MLDAGIVDDGPYAVLVTAYGKAGLHDRVDHVLRLMESNNVQPETMFYNALINAHSKIGAPERAYAILKHMQNTGELRTSWLKNEHSRLFDSLICCLCTPSASYFSNCAKSSR